MTVTDDRCPAEIHGRASIPPGYEVGASARSMARQGRSSVVDNFAVR